jgi:lipopolysaccharide transport system permease protein
MTALVSSTPRDPGLWTSLWSHRTLIRTLTQREISGRYRGSMLGIFWSFLNPLLMLGIYTFVFTEVFRMRWTAAGTNKFEFAVVLFAGLLMFSIFAECMTRAPGLIVGNPNYVKKVVFPLQIFTWVSLFTALFHFGIGLLVLLGAKLYVDNAIPFTALLLPVVLVPFLLFCAGLTWFLSALGVYVRDIGQIIGVVVTALMFLSPLFFPAAAVPEAYRALLHLNPLTFPIEQTRNVLVWGTMPNWAGVSVYFVACLAVAQLGLWWFNRTRRGFADVL